MDCRHDLVKIIGEQYDKANVEVPMQLVVEIAMELERLARIRQALDPNQRDF